MKQAETIQQDLKCVWFVVVEHDLEKRLEGIKTTTLKEDSECAKCNGYNLGCVSYVAYKHYKQPLDTGHQPVTLI